MADDPRFIGDSEPEPPPVADKANAKKAAGPRFKQDAAAAGSQRTVAIVVVLFLLAALAGVVVSLPGFLSPPPKPRLLTVHVERYDSPGWGVAAWARADADALVAAFHEPDAGRSADADRNFLQADKLRARLAAVAAELADPGAAKRPLVLSVSGLAAVRADGVPCLLPTDADPFDTAKWLPLDDILKALEVEKPVARLLLLDLARPTADPFLGRPADEASTAVCDLLKRRQAEGKLPCPVLTAAGPGEVSLPAPRAKLSAFGQSLSDGLGGQAAGVSGGKADEVTVAGLARFVAARVERFARTVHDRPQHPHLFAPADGWDFVLATRMTPQAPTVSTDPTRPEEYAYPPPLRAAWKRWDGLLAGNADRDEPEGFARLTAGLLRAERLWLGTDDAGSAGNMCDLLFIDWDDVRRALRPAGRAADDGADPRATAARLRLATRDGPEPPPELKSALNRYLSARLVPDAKPESWKADEQAWTDKAAADPKAAARLVWRRLADDPEPTRERVRALADELAKQTAGDRPPPLERLLALYLAERRFQTEQGLSYPAEAVAAWLRAEDRLGQVLAAGPTGFGGVRRQLDDAEAARREAAGLLFGASSGAQAKAAAERFAAAADGFEQVMNARRTGPKVAATVPPLLRAVLLHQPGAAAAGGEAFENWKEAARRLDALLGGQRLDPAATAKLADEATAATKRLTDAATPARVEELEKRPAPWGKPEVLRSALVSGPGLPADGRAKVWELVRREWWAKHDEARKLDAADVDARTVPPAIGTPPAVDADPADRRRAESAATLLRLALGGDAPAAAWRTEMPQRAGRAVQSQDWPTAARLLRVVPPAVAAVPRGMPPVAPLDKPAADDRAAYRRWLTEQLRDGYLTPVGGTPLRDKIDPDRALRKTLAAADSP